MTGKPNDPCGSAWREAEREATYGTDADVAEAVNFIRLHCLAEGATAADAVRFAIAHCAVTLRTMIERQERGRLAREAALMDDTEKNRRRMVEYQRRRREAAKAAGLCRLCFEAEPPAGLRTCDDCRRIENMLRRERREREPVVKRFEVALSHARRGVDPRGALDYAGLLQPLLRGEL